MGACIAHRAKCLEGELSHRSGLHRDLRRRRQVPEPWSQHIMGQSYLVNQFFCRKNSQNLLSGRFGLTTILQSPFLRRCILQRTTGWGAKADMAFVAKVLNLRSKLKIALPLRQGQNAVPFDIGLYPALRAVPAFGSQCAYFPAVLSEHSRSDDSRTITFVPTPLSVLQ